LGITWCTDETFTIAPAVLDDLQGLPSLTPYDDRRADALYCATNEHRRDT
jgi:hypothetical protein